jgi:ABC-2 type transport system ATP-binding protein
VAHALDAHGLALAGDGSELVYTYDTQRKQTGVTTLLRDVIAAGVQFDDLRTDEDSLEEVVVDLLKERQ